MNHFELARLYGAVNGNLRHVFFTNELLGAFGTYKSFNFKHVDLPNKQEITYNKLCDVFKFHVPHYFKKDYIINDILSPMAYLVNYFEFDISKVKRVDFFILTNEASAQILSGCSMGIQGRIAPHEYIIAVRNAQGCIETILHELIHIIDDEIDQFMLKLHKKLFDYHNRFYEIRAFSLSKLIHAQLLLTRTTSTVKIHQIQKEIIEFTDDLIERKENFIEFYSDAPEFAPTMLFSKVVNTMSMCINRLTDFINCF